MDRPQQYVTLQDHKEAMDILEGCGVRIEVGIHESRTEKQKEDIFNNLMNYMREVKWALAHTVKKLEDQKLVVVQRTHQLLEANEEIKKLQKELAKKEGELRVLEWLGSQKQQPIQINMASDDFHE